MSITTNWISLTGPIEISKDEIVFSTNPVNIMTVQQAPYTWLRGSPKLKEGSINIKAIISTPQVACAIGLQTNAGILIAGLNIGYAPYGIGIIPSSGPMIILGTSGHGSTLKTDEPYDIRCEVKGSSIELFINNISVVSAVHPISNGNIHLFFQGHGSAKVNKFEYTPRQPECFVVMQFSEEYNSVYTHVIKPTCEEQGYKVIRADEFYNSELILNDIIASIEKCSLIIADITPDNSNVFYEVGYAHGIKKNTILLSNKSRSKLPFDVQGFRTLFYENSIAGKEALQNSLKQHLKVLQESSSHTTPGGI